VRLRTEQLPPAGNAITWPGTDALSQAPALLKSSVMFGIKRRGSQTFCVGLRLDFDRAGWLARGGDEVSILLSIRSYVSASRKASFRVMLFTDQLETVVVRSAGCCQSVARVIARDLPGFRPRAIKVCTIWACHP